MAKTVLLVGGTGFIGEELGIALTRRGMSVRLLTRGKGPSANLAFPAESVQWGAGGEVPARALAGVDAVVNLAGESVATGRWNAQKKKRILSSRVNTTEALVAAANAAKVGVFVQASAIGFYGDTAGQETTEAGQKGRGFLADVSEAWEAPLAKLESATRAVVMRLGVVLGGGGGALNEMLTPYVLGVGAKIASGKHYMSWIHIEDICRFVKEAIDAASYRGVYNLTAPIPATYEQLHQEMVAYFGGFRSLQVPQMALKLGLGEKSSMLLMDQNVIPGRLLEQGFSFQYEDLSSCLEDVIGKTDGDCAYLNQKQWVSKNIEDVWEFFSSEKNLERITPEFLNFQVEKLSTPKIQKGSLIDYRLKIHGVPVKWRTKITSFEPQRYFQDIQLRGPYKVWHHCHYFDRLGEGTLIIDHIKFKVPFGKIGGLIAYPFVRKDVEKIFQYRRGMVAKIFN